MNESLLNRILKDHKRRTRSLALILCLSMIVSLGTFAGFHKTAIAKVYTREVLDCPYTHEGAEPVAHVHNDDCYDGETLICTLPERAAHTHDDTCYAESRMLSCGLEENPGHQHSEECFDENGELICQIPEGEGAHVHTDDCYTIERALICNQPELPVHVHDAGCFRTEEITVDEPEETAASEQAVNTVPEMPVSDPNADLETADDWNREFENLELSGNWARDLVLVAATQQGRGESPNNFEAVLNDAGDAWVRHGYTRYGAWYGYPYAEWDAMFVSFCLRYAGIPTENVPNNPTAAFMAESFSMGGLFAGRDYIPAVGDLIFFDTVDDEITNIDHMGIVYHVDAENGTINAVEGDRTDIVTTFGYHLDDEQIVGYGILPQNPNYVPTSPVFMTTDEEEEKQEETTTAEEAPVPEVPMPAQSWERTAGGIKVSVEAPEGAFPENTKIAVTPVNGSSLKDTVSDAVDGAVLEVQAVDITFFDENGREIEPAVPIRVVMTPAATEHAEEKTSVVHVDIAQQTAELIEQAEGTEADNSEVVFDAEAFTIYAIVYTVDFEYEVDGNVYQYSIEGGSSITLSELVEILHVDTGDLGTAEFVSEIESVVFSNPALVEVVKTDTDWVLYSLQPFQTEETLTVTMRDGQSFVVRVTDAMDDSAGYTVLDTSKASITVTSTGDAIYDPNSKKYAAGLKLQFELNEKPAAGNQLFEFDLANGITIPDNYLNQELEAYDSVTGHVSFRYKFVKDGDSYKIKIAYLDDYLAEMTNRPIGMNTIELNVNIGKEYLQDDGSLKGKFIDDVDVTVPTDQIKYPDGSNANSDISINKSFGGYDKSSNKMKYTVVVSSVGGTQGTVSVEDVLSVNDGQTALELKSINLTSVKSAQGNRYYYNNEAEVTGYSHSEDVSSKKLSVSGLPAMGENSVYVLEYEYELSDTIAASSDFESSGTNQATAKTNDDLEVTTGSNWNISKTGIALSKNGNYDQTSGKVVWTINVTNNTDAEVPLTDEAFKDLEFSDLTINPALEAPNFDKTTGKLTIPANSSYTITYQGSAALADPTKAGTVQNKVTAGDPDHGGKEITGTASVPAEAGVSKQVQAVSSEGSERILTWRVTINVPKSGFKADTTFTDNVSFSEDWNNKQGVAYFTDAQRSAYVGLLKSYFGSNVTVSEGTPIVVTLNSDWDGTASDGQNYAGKQIILSYATTADGSKISSDNNSYTNEFKLNDTPAQANYSFKEPVVKKANENDARDETTASVDQNNNKLHWYIQVSLDRDVDSITVNDILPQGLSKVTEIALGQGENKGSSMSSLYSSDGGATWGTVSDWGYGVAPWQYTPYTAITPSATVSGQNVTITVTKNEGEDTPDYFKQNRNFYFYIEAEVDDSEFPATGATTKNYTNTVNVSLNGTPYGSDDQTQITTLKTDVIDKSGDSQSNWNGANGAHEISYTVDINPGGGHLCYDENGNAIEAPITLTDSISYYRNVTDNAGNSHKVSINLKEGSAKLQRKDASGNWVDIPATEGWGYTLNENGASPDPDRIKVKEINVFGIPDDTVLRFVYTYNVEVEDMPRNATVNLGAIRNTATLKATFEESSSHTETKDWKNARSSASTESSGALTLVKVQKGNYAVTLPDTYFKLEKYDNGSWTPIDAVGSTLADPDGSGLKVYKADNNGKLIIAADPRTIGQDGQYAYDQLYRVREYKPQDGFYLDTDSDKNPAGYFFFHQIKEESDKTWKPAGINYNSTSSHADNLLIEADTVYLENEPIQDTITATKRWNASTTWPNNVIRVELALVNATTGEVIGKPETAGDEWQNPQTLTATNPTAKWENLDIASTPLSSYKVVETKILLSPDNVELERDPETYLASEYTWSDNPGNLIYETFGGKVTNGMATIVNMGKTKLDVEKKWTSQEGIDGLKVVLTLTSRERRYAQNGVIDSVLAAFSGDYAEVQDQQPIELDGTADSIETTTWKASFENLNKFRYDEATGILYEIQYSVSERVMLGERDVTNRYMVTTALSPDGQKVTVTNAPNVGQLAVQKVWQRTDENHPNEAPSNVREIVISLERYYVNGNNEKVNDNTFATENRGISIDGTSVWQKSETERITWAQLFENLQRQIQVEENGEIKTYDYHYVVKEDTVEGYSKIIAPGDIVLSDGKDGQVSQITVTNVENEEKHEEDDIDIKLQKLFTDDTGVPTTIPEGASADFRLYRYITIERGDYDLINKTMTPNPNESQARDKDLAFNGADRDTQWTIHIDSNTESTEVRAEDGTVQYSYFNTGWNNIPITETYIRGDTYVKYTYEYYIVERNATDSAYHSFTPMFIGGSESSPLTSDWVTTDDEGNKSTQAAIYNIPSDKTLTLRKYWVMLDQDSMPGVVVQLYRRALENGNPKGEKELVTTFGTSSNGVFITGAQNYVMADGTAVTGYLLNKDNAWNISFSGLDEGYQYIVQELGYLGKKLEDDELKDVVIPLDSGAFLSRHYKYNNEQHYELNLGNLSVAQLENYFSDYGEGDGSQSTTKNNYGTFSIGNVPIRAGYQLHLEKKWYSFTGAGGFADITSGYDGKGNGSKEAVIVMQVYQRPYWALNTYGHQGQWAKDEWIEYKKPLEISYSSMDAAGSGFPQSQTQHNGWVDSTLQESAGFAQYGYELNDQGIYELVFYEYKFVEVGMKPGSDGRTYRTYSAGYKDEPENHEDNPTYYSGYGKVLIENYETGLLKLIKDWKLNTDSKANKIFFTIVDHRGRDIGKEIYESEYKEYYGITEDQVAYIRELDKYVIILDADDVVSDNENRWELMLRGLDVVEEITKDENGNYVGKGEVTYTVEEVGCEKQDGTISSVADSSYPYTATYYRKVRFNGEQLVGNTASGNEDGSPMVAGGLQLDSGRAYNETGSLTQVRVINSDEPHTNLTVEKKWPGDQYPDQTMRVVLGLQQRQQKTDANNQPLWQDEAKTIPDWEGDWQAAEGTSQVSVTLPRTGYSGRNAWTYNWKGLPIYKVVSETGTENEHHTILWYRVIETSTPGWTSSVVTTFDADNNEIAVGADAYSTYSGNTGDNENPISQTIENKVVEEDLHIAKKWTNLYAKESDKSETWNEDHSINWPEGYSVGYKVVRHAYLVSVNNGEDETVSRQDIEGNASSYVQKTVNYSRGFEVEDWKQDPFASGSLTSQKQSVDLSKLPKGAIIRTDDNPPAGLYANYTYAVEYEYEVIETSITRDGVTTQVNVPASSANAQITNSETGVTSEDPTKVNATITNDLTNIEVQKNWGDSYDHSADTVTVQLYSSHQRPDGQIPVESGKITIYVKDLDTKGRTDMDQGKIKVTVAGDDGSSADYELTASNSWSVTADNLPETSANTGNPINYTVTVKSVDGSVIQSASISGESAVTVGQNVILTAEVVEPPAMFRLTFKPTTWIERDVWQAGASEPSDTNAYITATVTGGGKNYTYTLNKQNNWGADISQTLPVNGEDGNPISYKVQLQKGTSIYAIRRVENDNEWDNDNTFITGSKNQTVTVGYRPVKEKEQSQGGNQGGGDASEDNITITATVSGWKKWIGQYEWQGSEDVSGAPSSGKIVVKVKSGWGSVLGEIELTAENNWTATQTFNQKSFNGYANGERVSQAECAVSDPIKSASANYNNGSITVTGTYKEEGTVNASSRRNLMRAEPSLFAAAPAPTLAAAPMLAATAPKTFTIVGSGDKTPIDAVAVGNAITLSNGNWSHLWENLPTTDENGDPIYYYVKELSATVDGDTEKISTSYEYEKHDNSDARRGYAIVRVTNTTTREEKESASGTVSFDVKKVFQNGDTWPEAGFQFRLSQPLDDTEHPSKSVVLTEPIIVTIKQVTADGKATFTPAIQFNYESKNGTATTDQTGTYWFLIEEVLPEGVTADNPVKDGIKYDTSKQYIQVDVSYTKGSTELTVTKTTNPTPTSAPTEASPDATFTNEKLKEISAKKEWHDIGDNTVEWPNDLSITLTLHRKAGDNVDDAFAPTYTVNKNNLTVGTAINGTGEDAPKLTITKSDSEQKEYEFKVKDLPAVNSEGTDYTYYFTETQVGGYQSPLYKKGSVTDLDGAKDGYVIINRPQDSYVLPQTGGIGTKLFTALGGLMTATAGAILTIRRKRKPAEV